MIIQQILWIGLLFSIAIASTNTWSQHRQQKKPSTFHFRVLEPPSEKLSRYTLSLFSLALEQTTHSHGPYIIQLVQGINKTRTLKTAKENRMENFFFVDGYNAEHSPSLLHSNIPISQGTRDYKVCFRHKDKQIDFSKINSLSQLTQFRVGQSARWNNTAILKSNGFDVVETKNDNSLFLMLERKRFDLLCGGINSFGVEKEIIKQYSNIVEEKSFALYYPSPRFFWTNKRNAKVLQRINAGLEAAFENGSLQKVFDSVFQNAEEQGSLNSRKIFPLKGNHAQTVPPSYIQYYRNLHTKN